MIIIKARRKSRSRKLVKGRRRIDQRKIPRIKSKWIYKKYDTGKEAFHVWENKRTGQTIYTAQAGGEWCVFKGMTGKTPTHKHISTHKNLGLAKKKVEGLM